MLRLRLDQSEIKRAKTAVVYCSLVIDIGYGCILHVIDMRSSPPVLLTLLYKFVQILCRLSQKSAISSITFTAFIIATQANEILAVKVEKNKSFSSSKLLRKVRITLPECPFCKVAIFSSTFLQ